MSGFSSVFSFFSGSGSDELPELFPFGVLQKNFVEIDVENIYRKILTDVFERAEGLSEDQQSLLWDNCLKSEKSHGLITLLARAMACKTELFLVLDKASGVLRRATGTEQAQIRADYEKQAESASGVYLSFAQYTCTDMIRIYSALEYCTVAALNKSMNLSNAVQVKINELRASVGLGDSSGAKAQAQKIAQGLKDGKAVLLDSKDTIETASPDSTATKTSMELFNQKRSFYLNLPASYITGELAGGLGDTGKADAKAVERGLKGYFVSIVKPTCKALFNASLTFKSQDFDDFQTSLEALKTFDIVSDEYLSAETKLKIINKRFGLDPDTKGGPADDPALTPENSKPNQDPPNAKTAAPGAPPAY